MAKFGICGKCKDKWKPKALELFWHDFIELANNGYSYALLKSLIFLIAKFGEIQHFWQKF